MRLVTSRSFAMIIILLMLLILHSEYAVAQCPMCKIAAESNLENGGTAGKGLNMGILYILSVPYMLVGALGYIWWKNKKNQSYDDVAKWN